jgi:hypothetical protein
MNKKLKTVILALVVFTMVSSCTINNDAVDSASYAGEALVIGVVGEIPEIREKQIDFEKIDLETLKSNQYNFTYDGILIMKDYFEEASKGEYASIYKRSSIPIFFIESKKSYVPFITENLSYESVAISDELNYATGIFVLGEEMKCWSYGLYNDVQNETNIKDVYSRIFRDIERSIYSDQIEIYSSVEKYTLSMSSVPGLPLTVQLNTAELDDQKEYIWASEKGEFLTWEKTGGKVKLLEGVSSVKTDTIYWIPCTLQWNDSIQLIVDIKNPNNNKIIGRKKVKINSSDKGWYSLN